MPVRLKGAKKVKKQTMIGIRGGGATRKTGSCCDLTVSHSELDSESINSARNRLRLGGRSDEGSLTPLIPFRHSDESQSLSMPINLICHFSWQKRKKAAFTLAEVLITLGIIGIVAAMTLPSLINNIRNKDLEARFKTAYSLVSQAVLRMSLDEPEIAEFYCARTADGTFGDELNNTFIPAFSKYFQTTTVNNNRNDSMYLTRIGYSREYFVQPYRSEFFNNDGHDNGYMILKNGMIIFSSGCWWDGASGAPVDFIVDTNGLRGPNKLGYDVFYFQIVEDNILMPSNSKYTYIEAATSDESCCNFEEGGTCAIPIDNGVACTYFALMDRYPNDESKSYWKSLP